MALPGGIGMLLGMAGINPDDLVATAKTVGEKVQAMADAVQRIEALLGGLQQQVNAQAVTLASIERKTQLLHFMNERMGEVANIRKGAQPEQIPLRHMDPDEFGSRRLAIPLEAITRAVEAPHSRDQLGHYTPAQLAKQRDIAEHVNRAAAELDFGV